jgi:hypothetical protein
LVGPAGADGADGTPGATTVVALTDRYEELPSQTFSDFAHAGAVAASPTRDIQTAIDATPVGPACQVIVGPGSYGGATVTIPTGRNNISIIGPSAGDFGGTVVTLSSGRALTIGNNAVRVRIVNLQVEGLTTISTTGAGVHRIERCQLEGGLTIGAISATIYIVGSTLGSVTIDAGFTGTILIDRCLFNAGATYTNNTQNYLKVLISDSAGLATAPTLAVSTNAALLNGRFQISTGSSTYYADGTALLKAPLTAINSLTPAADRIAYYTSASAGALTTLTSFARTLLDDADAATARATLGLGTAATSAATSFQSADATLTALAGLTTAANKLPYFTGVDAAAVADITTAGREILSTASSGTSGQVLTSSGGGAPTWTAVSSGSSTSTGYYGSFFDTTTQTHTSANTAKSMTLNQTPPAAGTEASGVSIVSGSRITVANAGVYNIQFSAQLDNSDSQEHDADIWIALNGTTVANSNTQITVPASHGSTNGNEVAAWNFVLTLAAGDYIELKWSVHDVSISLPTYSPVSPHPATPSLIVTVSQVAVLGGQANVQVFTSDGTWTKPATAKSVEVVAIGGGGGGGSGIIRAAAATRGGGAGGGGAGITRWALPASTLTSTVSVTVGQGGSGGAATTSTAVNGNAGAAGTASTFGAYVYAAGGSGGAGGAGVVAPVGGSGGTASVIPGGSGGNGGAGATSGPTVGSSALGAAGGGGGGSITNGNTAQAGASGGTGSPFLAGASALSGGAGGAATGVAGTAGTSSAASQPFGGGGGGGGGANHVASGSVIGGNGGAGGSYGGGGGGGGSGTTSTTTGQSGAGGAGANGIVIVIAS